MTTSTRGESILSRQGLESFICEKVAAMVGALARDILPNEPLQRYGVSSAQALELMALLSARTGRQLAPTLAWEHPSAEALARRIAEGPKVREAAAGRPGGVGANEPIAIVGIACRFPGGADDPRAFWRLLRDGVDAVGEPPAGRAGLNDYYDPDPTRAGTTHVRRGGFLKEVDGFDPQFFGISPREAEHMDPQQRLALELAWEAMEDAGVRADVLKGSRTGVFFGVGWHDYADLLKGHPEAIVSHTGTGQSTCVIPNRVSYVFGLRGPSIGVDTACSSSLVAVHLACQSLRSGESTLALAGGVNLALHPETWVALAKFGGLSPDGVCRAFAEGANGFVRGEGGGAVLLKPLSRALADGDPIYCVIRGSAINNDGASNGLTAPNPAAQVEMLRDAYANAGVDPAAVHYVEAHGTGTALGDPIEAGALGEVLGSAREPERPLRVGSVKTNLGHLEIAAGIAGLIKAALALQHREIPPSLHFTRANPLIPFESLRLQVAASRMPWPAREDEVARAGVSAFGWGGTNCHVVLEAGEVAPAQIVPLAAETQAALIAAATELRAQAADPAGPLFPELCRAAALRARGRHRLAITARTRGELASKLDGFLEGRTVAGLASGEAPEQTPRIAFVLSPQGGQWLGMGRELMRTEPAFRAKIEACDAAIRRHGGWSLIEELSSDVVGPRSSEVDRIQPATFAVQVALAALLESWGVLPGTVVGHSLGEIGAAHLAGILDLDDAARVICHYSRLQATTAGNGGMAIVGLSVAQAERRIAGRTDRVCIAAINGEAFTVLSGEPEVLDAVIAELKQEELFAVRVQVNVAAHSPQIDPIMPELRQVLADIRPVRAARAMLSTCTGEYLLGKEVTGDYFARNLRQIVLLRPAVRRLLDEGIECFVEISAHPILRHTIQQSVAASGRAARVIASARRNEERAAMLDAIGALFVAGAEVRWENVHRGACEAADSSAAACPFEVLPVSGRSPGALAEQARRWAEFLEKDGGAYGLRDIVDTAQRRRAHLEHRLAVVGRTHAELVEQLRAVEAGEGAAAAKRAPRVVFVFPGYGAQWLGMGRRLAETEPVFRRALVACDAALARLVDYSVVEQLFADADHSRMREAVVVQPMTFALQVALASLLRHWGIEPAAVVGHSMGEVAAAHVAGALSLEDAARVIVARSRVVQEHASHRGGMLMLTGEASEATAIAAEYAGRVSLGASNAPRMQVLSGDLPALEEIAEELKTRGVFCRRVNVDYASHSPHMDPLLPLLREALSGVAPREPRVPFCSTVRADFVKEAALDAAYWAANLREPVQFAPAVARLAEGHELFVEISTHPLLVTAIEETLRERGAAGEAIAVLRREEDEALNVRRAVARLFERGCAIDWAAMNPAGGRPVPLPTYAWQRERYWIDVPPPGRQGAGRSDYADWVYRVRWEPSAAAGAVPEEETTWVVLADGAGLGERLCEQLWGRGRRCLRVAAGPAFQELGAGRFVVDPAVPEDMERVLAAARAAGPQATLHVVHLWSLDIAPLVGLDEAGIAAMQALGCVSALHVVQGLARAGQAARLSLVTQGAQVTGTNDGACSVGQVPLWGMGRVLAYDFPALACKRIDVERGPAAAQAEALLAELGRDDAEDEVALRAGARLSPRLVAAESHEAVVRREGPEVPAIHADATYVITGGLGGLGLRAAQWLAQHGARHVVLLGRTAPGEQARAAIATMEAAGVEVKVASVDVAAREPLAEVFAEVRRTMPAIRGVLHAAGTMQMVPTAELDRSRLVANWAPKVQGTLNLAALLVGEPLDFFALYASSAGVLALPGMAGYAAANAFLDGVAWHLRAQGRPALSVDWGAWAEAGMVVGQGPMRSIEERLELQGIPSMSPGTAMSALGRLLALGETQATVMRLDARRWLEFHAGARRLSLLRRFGAAAAKKAEPAARSSLAERLAGLPAREQARALEEQVRGTVAAVLGLKSSHSLDPERGLRELGLDSLLAVELRRRLAEATGLPLPATLAFDHPTVRAIAEFVRPQLVKVAEVAAAAPAVARTAGPEDEAIAIVGIGCRYPGGARDAESLWRLLCDEVDVIREIPADRWDIDAYYDPERGAAGRMYARGGGFLEDADRFDAAFFNISPREALKMDPQQRVLLEVTWEAIEDAGLPAESLVGTDAGVFVTGAQNQYLGRLGGDVDAYAVTGNLVCTLSGRLSYFLGLRGPNVYLDTGCSGSLVAVHLACQSLRVGECRVALAGGVNLLLDPAMTVGVCNMGALAPDARCKTFDAAADGFARSEGCGMVVLKRLADAKADGDRVLAVIRGSATGHDGASSGLTAPSGPAQQAVIRKALAQAKVGPEQVAFVETHGTGTELGDPIEVGALAATYGAASGRAAPCLVGAIKSNLGHTEAAAGVAGLIKVVQALRYAQVPANLHFRAANPKLPLEGAALEFPTRLRAWPEAMPRMAAVSSFGLGGTNAHAIVAAAPEAAVAEATEAGGAVLVPLSAKHPAALRALAEKWGEMLAGAGASIAALAATAALRRSHHSQRLALVARDRAEAAGKLAAWLRGETVPGVVVGARTPGASGRVVFVFSGQGSQWIGMGRTLVAQDPAFRAAFEACEAAIERFAGWSLRAEIHAAAEPNATMPVDVIQPAIFAMQVSLAAALRARGIEPDAVVGHSMGEVAAAHVAGAIGLEDAVRVICTRSRLARERASGRGGMAVVELPVAVAEARVAERPGLSVAVHNSPRSVVLSGDAAALDEVLAELESEGVWLRRVQVDYASHSPQMDPLMPVLREALAGIGPRAGSVQFFSTVTGRVEDGARLDANYWAENLRARVRFAEAIQALAQDGAELFVELSPHPLLTAPIEENLAEVEREGAAVATLRRTGDEAEALLATLGALYVRGYPLAWERLYTRGAPVPLPKYPWQHQRFWVDPPQGNGRAAGLSPAVSVGGEYAQEERGSVDGASLVELWRGAGPAERRGVLEAAIRQRVGAALAMAPDLLDAKTPFPAFGLDSMMASQLRRDLERRLELKLGSAVLLRHPTIAALAEYVERELMRAEPGQPAEVREERPAPARAVQWTHVWRPRPRAAVQLVCFHFAGGGASMFRGWAEALGPEVEVCAVQLPGREERIDEAPFTRLGPLLDALEQYVVPTLRRPFACFGHSMGALVAFELARRLAARGVQGPAQLVLSGCPAPRARGHLAPIHALPEPQFREALRRSGGTPPEVLEDEELMQIYSPLLRADFAVGETWPDASGPALGCPITALAGEDDPIAPLDAVVGFGRETRGRFALHRFPGAHFFVNTAREAVIAEVRAELTRSGLLAQPRLVAPMTVQPLHIERIVTT